jgi:hypothetical protein
VALTDESRPDMDIIKAQRAEAPVG